MINTEMRYFIYARKSTDEADRQVLSIGSQLAELREYARREGLAVVREFVESKTAKEPGREVFNDMLTRMERGAALSVLGRSGGSMSSAPPPGRPRFPVPLPTICGC